MKRNRLTRPRLATYMDELNRAEAHFERAGMDPCRAYYATLQDYTVAFHWSRRLVVRCLNAIMDSRTGVRMYHDRAYAGYLRLALRLHPVSRLAPAAR